MEFHSFARGRTPILDKHYAPKTIAGCSPAVGAVLISLSTIIVALNAKLLRSLDLRPS